MVKNYKRFITGMTGVYAVATELSSRGYIVTITSRNAPHVDIIVSTPNLKKTFNIQVKANNPYGTKSFWLLNKEAKNIKSNNFIYLFVNLKENVKPDFYIVKSRIVAKNIDVNHSKSGHWYSFQRDNKFKDKWTTLS